MRIIARRSHRTGKLTKQIIRDKNLGKPQRRNIAQTIDRLMIESPSRKDLSPAQWRERGELLRSVDRMWAHQPLRDAGWEDFEYDVYCVKALCLSMLRDLHLSLTMLSQEIAIACMKKGQSVHQSV